jgi:hypothetical protein
VAAQRDADEQTEFEDAEVERPAIWSEVRIDPVEIALPKGVGYTLRAYRLSTEVTPTDVSEREIEEFPERPRPVDDEEDDTLIDAFGDQFDDEDEHDYDPDEYDDAADEDATEAASGDKESDEDEPDDDEDEDDEEETTGPEEVPVFLGRRGELLLFRSVEGLVEFVRSDAEHDLSQLDTWADLAGRVTPEDVVPLPEDTYELDLVVGNLRGGRDAWDAELVIQAGEIARDLGYALRIDRVISALAPGSPLDDLDEALRASTAGGLGGFLAKRRMKKIGAEAAPLGWRTIIGNISAVVDWRD